MKTLDKQIFFLAGIYIYLMRLVEESIAELPKLQRLVRKILILNLIQAYFAISVSVFLKLFALYQVKIAVNFFRKSVCIANIIENREEDDKQFFIEVNLAFLVDRFK